MQVDARLTLNKVRFDQEAEAHLVVSLTAPAGKVEEKRPSLCIVPLLDLSSSMVENDKLVYAKKSLIKLIDHLTPNDYCGLITFAYQSKVVQKPVRCTAEAKDDLKRKIGALHASGATNIGAALLDGFRVCADMDLATEVIPRVILFTDGGANTGEAKTPEDILALVKPNIGGASISAFGYGPDAVQDFLINLSKSGNGNYSFVQNPDDALSAFGKELGGLLSTYGTNLVIQVAPLAGHKITQVVSDVEAEEEDSGDVVIKIPDILAEETRHIVIALKLTAQKNAFPREVNVVDVQVGYDTLDATLRREHKSIEAKAKVQFVKLGEEQKAADPELDRIVGLAQIVRAQIEAEEHAKKGNYHEASVVMDSVSFNVGARGLADLGNVAQNVRSRVSSQSAYVSSSGYLASISRGATRGVGGTYDAAAALELKTAGVVMSNSTQAMVASAFTADDPVDQAPELADQLNGLNVARGGSVGSIHIGDAPGLLGWVPTTTTTDHTGSGWSSSGLTVYPQLGDPPVQAILTPFVSPQPAEPAPAKKPTRQPAKKAEPKGKRKIAQKSNRW